MNRKLDDYIELCKSGKFEELYKNYYDKDLLMYSGSEVFASSGEEAYNKQIGFYKTTKSFEITLISKKNEDDVSELVFKYKMESLDSELIEFTGKHILYWKNGKVIKEEYSTVE